MRTKKRTLVTTKVYGFNPWMDQLLATNQMMEATGQKSEAPSFETSSMRLSSRAGVRCPARKYLSSQRRAENPTRNLRSCRLCFCEFLNRGHSSFRVQRIGIELLQENLVETRASGMRLWEALTVPSLSERGSSVQQIAELFDTKTDEAKDFAYGLAEEIRDQIDAADSDSAKATVDDDDRQGRFVYDDSEHVADTNVDAA
jgi:hypothetical protein